MAEKQPTLVVAPKREPSLLNRTAFVGLGVGMILGNAIPMATPIGLAIGAWRGKKRMEREQLEGKVVEPPSSWNLGTLLGGSSALTIAGTVAGLAVLSPFAAMGIPVVAAVGAVAALGAFIGGKIGKQFEKREYYAAQEQVMREGPFQPPHMREQAQGVAPQVEAPQQGMEPQQQVNRSQAVSNAGQQMDPRQLAELQALAQQGQKMAAEQPQQGAAEQQLQAQRQRQPQQPQRS